MIIAVFLFIAILCTTVGAADTAIRHVITRHNFAARNSEILASASRCTFMAFDLELTGIDGSKECQFPEDLLSRVAVIADSWQIVEVGLALFFWDKESDTFSSEAYSFLVGPGSPLEPFVSNGSTMAFLKENGLSIDYWVSNYIPLLLPEHFEEAKKNLWPKDLEALKAAHALNATLFFRALLAMNRPVTVWNGLIDMTQLLAKTIYEGRVECVAASTLIPRLPQYPPVDRQDAALTLSKLINRHFPVFADMRIVYGKALGGAYKERSKGSDHLRQPCPLPSLSAHSAAGDAWMTGAMTIEAARVRSERLGIPVNQAVQELFDQPWANSAYIENDHIGRCVRFSPDGRPGCDKQLVSPMGLLLIAP